MTGATAMQPTDLTPPFVPPAPRPRRRLWLWVAIGALAAVVLAVGAVIVVRALAPSDSPLAALQKRDPNGAKACTTLSAWLQGDVRDDSGQPSNPAIVGLAVADWTAASTTPAIKAAYAGPLLDPQTLALLRSQGGYTGSAMALANLPKLYAGCVDAGLTMPPFTMQPTAAG